MSIGFRKSFLGFNSDDVMAYIEKTQKKHTEKITLLNEKIEELDEKCNKTDAELAALTEERDAIAAKLKEYTDKYDEIGRLSENIGKLYLVAQANAQAIMKNSEESTEMSKAEVEKNLDSLSEAHRDLENLRSELVGSTEDFSEKITALLRSLEQTRSRIGERTSDSEKQAENFSEVYQMLTK